MRSRSTVAKAIDNLARRRVREFLRVSRQRGRSVVTLVDISEKTALDPDTVEAVMFELEAEPDAPVRRATADQLRWHIRR